MRHILYPERDYGAIGINSDGVSKITFKLQLEVCRIEPGYAHGNDTVVAITDGPPCRILIQIIFPVLHNYPHPIENRIICLTVHCLQVVKMKVAIAHCNLSC